MFFSKRFITLYSNSRPLWVVKRHVCIRPGAAIFGNTSEHFLRWNVLLKMNRISWQLVPELLSSDVIQLLYIMRKINGIFKKVDTKAFFVKLQ